jgi:hypothetical protein
MVVTTILLTSVYTPRTKCGDEHNIYCPRPYDTGGVLSPACSELSCLISFRRLRRVYSVCIRISGMLCLSDKEMVHTLSVTAVDVLSVEAVLLVPENENHNQ